MTHPINDWEFDMAAEEAFTEWFNDLIAEGAYSLRSEWFYGDCELGDEKTRKDLLAGWVHSAYVAGYERGMYEGALPE